MELRYFVGYVTKGCIADLELLSNFAFRCGYLAYRPQKMHAEEGKLMKTAWRCRKHAFCYL